MKKLTPSEYYKAVKQQKKQVELAKKVRSQNKAQIDKVLDYKKKVVIKYPEYKEAFEYVDSKFPGLNVFNVTITKIPRKILEEAGYGGVGGLYIFHKKQVIVTDEPTGGFSKNSVTASLTIDEIIVHELLHYVSHKFGNSNSVIMEEEFAYGNSVPYLISKGYTDEEIVESNMLPFLYIAVDSNKILKEILQKKGITKAQYNALIREYKQGKNKAKISKLIAEISKQQHDEILEKAKEAGHLLVQKYRDLPDGEEEDDSDYGNINI